jgi:ornithine cyclodeaminase/alanine dehydrogenase-like protein (mu-crystallin family)
MEEKKESEQDTSKPVVPKEKLKRTQLNIAWGAQAKAKEEASPEQVQRQARFFPDLP